MDLQAILDATDSSEEEGEDAYQLPGMGLNVPPPSPRRTRPQMMMTPPRAALTMTAMSPLSTTGMPTPSKVDLEQILREDDEDEDDEYLSGSFYSSNHPKGSTGTPTTAYSSSHYNYTSTASNPEDWDVLQAIWTEQLVKF